MRVDELLVGLRDASTEIRLAAARGLDDVAQTPDVERALVAASRDDPDPRVRKWSLHALACAHCKPDGICSTDVVGVFVQALRNDRNGQVRRFAAGMMMHGQLGRDRRITDAFESVRNHPQRILRERAEWFLSFVEQE